MSKNLIKITFFCLSLCLLFIGKATLVESQQQKPKEEIRLVQTVIPNRLFGLTIDESSIEDKTYRARIIRQIETFKSQENQRPTVRIVLPVKNDVNELPPEYFNIIREIYEKKSAYIMVELVDSNSDNSGHSTKCFKRDSKKMLSVELSKNCYKSRVESMYRILGEYVDIWEIGNEINGDWFGGIKEDNKSERKQARQIVIEQVKQAYIFFENEKKRINEENERPNKVIKEKIPKTAITYYFNDDSNGVKGRHSYDDKGDEPEYSMKKWIEENGENFKKVDYVLISYYPDNNFYTPKKGDPFFDPNNPETEIPLDLSIEDWLNIFDLIKNKYGGDTKFGIGEMGTHCQFTDKRENCEIKGQCRPLNIDTDKGEQNPCNKYDTNGNILESRNCECCLCSQGKIIKDDYTDLDKQIRRQMKNDTRFNDDGRFIGGYFYWYYSADVINKMLNPNEQNNGTQKALIKAYNGWNQPLDENSLNSLQNFNFPSENKSITEPQTRVLQEGDKKSNPYTILIINNPAYEDEGKTITDPINNESEKFDESVNYIYANLFGNLPNQAERFLAEKDIKDKIRVVSVFDSSLAPIERNALIQIDTSKDKNGNIGQQLVTRQLQAFPEFFKGFQPYPDLVFVVSDYPNSKIRSTAFRTIEDKGKGGKKFALNGKNCKKCVHYYFPELAGGVAINVNDRSMTALHEFSHAASGFPNGYVADLYNDDKPESFMINKKVDEKYSNKKNCQGLFFNYNSIDYFIDEKDCRENEENVVHPERIDADLPALMDDYTVVGTGQFSEQCQHDKLTRQFLIDRIKAKTER